MRGVHDAKPWKSQAGDMEKVDGISRRESPPKHDQQETEK